MHYSLLCRWRAVRNSLCVHIRKEYILGLSCHLFSICENFFPTRVRLFRITLCFLYSASKPKRTYRPSFEAVKAMKYMWIYVPICSFFLRYKCSVHTFCWYKCGLSQLFVYVPRYFCSPCTILRNEGVVARTWKYDSLSRLPPGQFETRFADFFRVLSRGKRGGKREMEIEKLKKGESSMARYALSARPILRSLSRQSFFMLRHYLKRCTLSWSLPDEIPLFFNVQVYLARISMELQIKYRYI